MRIKGKVERLKIVKQMRFKVASCCVNLSYELPRKLNERAREREREKSIREFSFITE